MKRTDITRTIASLLITAAMLGVTGCGNVNTDTSSAAPKATTTASITEASATTTAEAATMTSESEETTSLSAATTTGTSASTSSKSSTTPKNTMMTAKMNSPKASNGGTVNNNQSYSHSTANNGSGNNSYSNDNNNGGNSYQPQQTERQTERQTTTTRQTTTAKKTQAPKPKPTTTTTAKPKANLTQSDIDKIQKEVQAYSNELARPRVEKIYAQFGYSSVDEYLADIEDVTLDNSSWVSGDNYYARETYDEVLQSLKEEIQGEYNVFDEKHLTQSILIILPGTDYYGNECWNTYLIRG